MDRHLRNGDQRMLKRLENAMWCALFGAFLLAYGSEAWRSSHPPPHENVSPSRDNQIKSRGQAGNNQYYWQWGPADPGSTIVTLLLVLVGGVQAGLFVWQLRIIKRTLKPAEDAAKAAQDTAKIAERSLTELERPLIGLQVVQVGLRYLKSDEFVDIIRPLKFNFFNYGRTPAVLLNQLDKLLFP